MREFLRVWAENAHSAYYRPQHASVISCSSAATKKGQNDDKDAEAYQEDSCGRVEVKIDVQHVDDAGKRRRVGVEPDR